MNTTRLEAFSDAVIAIIMTIMVLELKAPHGPEWEVLRPLLPVFLAYVMSYAYLGIYWSNHHHMIHATDHVDGKVLLANTHLLFWLSLIPFVTSWMAENHFAPVPTALYGVVLLLSALAYSLLKRAIVAHHGPQGRLVQAVGKDLKGKISIVAYAAAIPLAFFQVWLAVVLFVLVALLWLVPDSRIERSLGDEHA